MAKMSVIMCYNIFKTSPWGIVKACNHLGYCDIRYHTHFNFRLPRTVTFFNTAARVMTDSNVQPSVVRIFEDIFNGTQVKNADWIQQHQCRISSSSFGLLVKRSKAVEKAEREVKVTTRELMAMRKAIKPTSGKTGKKLQPQQKEVDRVEKRDEQKQKQLARTTQSLQRTPQQIRDSFDPSRPTPQNCQYGKCFEPYAVAAYLQWKGAAVVACHRSGMCVPTFCPQLSACPDRWLKVTACSAC